MRIENLTPSQWKLYNFLKDNAVGKTNIKTGKQIMACLGYKNLASVQLDIRALRISTSRKIASNSNGYWLPVDKNDDDHFALSKALSHIYTMIADGSLTKKQVHAFVEKIDVNKPLDNQMKLAFGDYEKDFVKRYSDDLVKKELTPLEQLELIEKEVDPSKKYDMAKALYMQVDGYPIAYGTDGYIKVIKERLGVK